MSTLESIKSELQEIIADSNATTGGNATTVRDGVDALIGGFGSGDLSDIITLLGDGEVVEGSGSGGSLDGLKDGWDVMFYDENNEGLAFYSIKQGHTIEAPMYDVQNWLDSNGSVIAFPYTPTADIILYAQANDTVGMLYEHFGVDRAIYPILIIGSLCYASNGYTDVTVYFGHTTTGWGSSSIALKDGYYKQYTRASGTTLLNTDEDVLTKLLEVVTNLEPNLEYSSGQSPSVDYGTNMYKTAFTNEDVDINGVIIIE